MYTENYKIYAMLLIKKANGYEENEFKSLILIFQ